MIAFSTLQRGMLANLPMLAALIAAVVTAAVAPTALRDANYVGTETCAGCHAGEIKAWTDSHHDLAMQRPSEPTVLGDFDNASFDHYGVITRFRREGDRFIVNTDGPDGELSETWAAARWDAACGALTLAGTSTGGGVDVVDLTVRGTTGAVRIWDWYRLQRDQGSGWTDVFDHDRAALGSAAYTAQLDQLALMMDGAEHSLATFAESLAVQELVEELLG